MYKVNLLNGLVAISTTVTYMFVWKIRNISFLTTKSDLEPGNIVGPVLFMLYINNSVKSTSKITLNLHVYNTALHNNTVDLRESNPSINTDL